MNKKEQIDQESIQRKISSFEELRHRMTPEAIEDLMNGATDGNFWNEENLRKSLEEDIAFPMKIWSGFDELIDILDLKKSEDPEAIDLIKEFDFLSQVVMRVDLPINVEARISAVKKIREVFSKIGISSDTLRASTIMKLAYLGEAEDMEWFGMDSKETTPFSVGLELNRSHPLVDEVMREEQEKRAKQFVDSDPDLTRIFDEYYKDKKPSVN